MDNGERLGNPLATGRGSWGWFLSLFMFILLAHLSVLFLEERWDYLLGREDGLFESFGALAWLTASVLFLITFRRDRTGTQLGRFSFKRNIFFLGLSIMFLFAFLEEISWGQRIFNFVPPEFIAKHNVQDEFTIHNLSTFHWMDSSGGEKSFIGKLFTVHRIFNIFWFVFCLGVPLVCRFSRPVRRLVQRINLPLAPLWISGLFLVNYLGYKVFKLMGSSPEHLPFDSAGELKESIYAVLFACLALYFLMGSRRFRPLSANGTPNKSQ